MSLCNIRVEFQGRDPTHPIFVRHQGFRARAKSPILGGDFGHIIAHSLACIVDNKMGCKGNQVDILIVIERSQMAAAGVQTRHHSARTSTWV